MDPNLNFHLLRILFNKNFLLIQKLKFCSEIETNHGEEKYFIYEIITEMNLENYLDFTENLSLIFYQNMYILYFILLIYKSYLL